MTPSSYSSRSRISGVCIGGRKLYLAAALLRARACRYWRFFRRFRKLRRRWVPCPYGGLNRVQQCIALRFRACVRWLPGRPGRPQILRHVLWREDGNIVRSHAHAVIVISWLPVCTGKKYVMIFGILGMRVMAILRGDEGDAGLLRKLYQERLDLLRFGNVRMFLNFQKIISFAENFLMFERDPFRLLVLVRPSASARSRRQGRRRARSIPRDVRAEDLYPCAAYNRILQDEPSRQA